MKKAIYGLAAIVIAVAAFAFTNVEKRVNYYWFPLNETSGAAQTLSSLPTYQASDPTGCNDVNKYCEGGFTSYSYNSQTGIYSAVGSPSITDFKP